MDFTIWATVGYVLDETSLDSKKSFEIILAQSQVYITYARKIVLTFEIQSGIRRCLIKRKTIEVSFARKNERHQARNQESVASNNDLRGLITQVWSHSVSQLTRLPQWRRKYAVHLNPIFLWYSVKPFPLLDFKAEENSLNDLYNASEKKQ